MANGPIRVAYVVHTLAMGGVERMMVMLANHLDRSCFEPVIVCLNQNKGVACWGIADDVRVLELHKRSGNDLLLPVRLAKALRGHRIDVVHSNNWGTLVETVVARRWGGVRGHVHLEHGVELGDLRPPWLKRVVRRGLMRWAFRRTDVVGSVCEDVSERVAQRAAFPRDRITVLASGVEVPPCPNRPEARHQVRATLGIGAHAVVVGSVGRLAPVKDFGNAIDAVAQLVRQGEDVHLALVSDGPERESLAKRAEERAIAPRVHLMGHQDELGPCLAAMDIYVNSSLSEGKSISLLEAMGFGLPLVATAVGESPALVAGDEPCGIVVPRADCTALALAIGRLAHDPQLRDAMARNAVERYQSRYSVTHMVQAYQNLYRKLARRDG